MSNIFSLGDRVTIRNGLSSSTKELSLNTFNRIIYNIDIRLALFNNKMLKNLSSRTDATLNVCKMRRSGCYIFVE